MRNFAQKKKFYLNEFCAKLVSYRYKIDAKFHAKTQNCCASEPRHGREKLCGFRPPAFPPHSIS